ncbi:MAG: UDP-glucose dehydrogenase family protein [Nocardioidaceae bacterium]
MALRATVIGTGYLGATHAACLAESGLDVLGVDSDVEKVGLLASGAAPFFEPGLAELIKRHVATGRLRFTTSYEDAADFGDVHFICVGTPQRADGLAADVSHLYSAVDSLAPHLHRPCVIVGKSTVPVGTAEALSARVSMAAPAGDDVELAWNPEFLREGHAVTDSLAPSRIVVGLHSELAAKMLRDVYSVQIEAGVPFLVMDLATAQLVKTAANAFLATKVSFMNAVADLCDAAGGDVVALADALGRDERIGGHYLGAGAGFGGGCLPKDIRALAARAVELGVEGAAALLGVIDEINSRRRGQLVMLARLACGGEVHGWRIGVLGAAFKARSDDVRDSPALNVAAELHRQGALVTVYDPAALANAETAFPALGYASSAMEAASGAHLVMHLTDWEEFQALDPDALGSVTARRYLVDGRNALDPQRWREAGWTFRALGRPDDDRSTSMSAPAPVPAWEPRDGEFPPGVAVLPTQRRPEEAAFMDEEVG